MRERPILFSAPMVRALLAGTKTQTRRVVKPQPEWENRGIPGITDAIIHWKLPATERCPYGQPGDRLWVRETWGVGTRPDPFEGWRDGIEYRADDFELDDIEYLPLHAVKVPDDKDLEDYRGGWKPSIHMPRWASRILLEVTGIRVERLQTISDADALAEGVDQTNTSIGGYATERYRRLWESINGAGSWDANPWVWLVEFRKC